jgi:hypothetical protein
MEAFKNAPIDIVNHILSYDERYIIRNGNIVDRLDKIKYKNIINLLEKKPKIQQVETERIILSSTQTINISYSFVKLSQNMELVCQINDLFMSIKYGFFSNKEVVWFRVYPKIISRKKIKNNHL